ncbi:unnamed protein product, partial [Ambrosiozyma monospora]
MNEELESHKRRIRAPVQSKIQTITEQRVAERKAALEKEYQDKLKDLETSSKEKLTSIVVENEKKKLLEEFQHEKEKLKKDTASAIRKEMSLINDMQKKQLVQLREELKKLKSKSQTASPQATPSPMAIPGFAHTSNTGPASTFNMAQQPTPSFAFSGFNNASFGKPNMGNAF